jgi:hypothetical protein
MTLKEIMELGRVFETGTFLNAQVTKLPNGNSALVMRYRSSLLHECTITIKDAEITEED